MIIAAEQGRGRCLSPSSRPFTPCDDYCSTSSLPCFLLLFPPPLVRLLSAVDGEQHFAFKEQEQQQQDYVSISDEWHRTTMRLPMNRSFVAFSSQRRRRIFSQFPDPFLCTVIRVHCSLSSSVSVLLCCCVCTGWYAGMSG